MSVISNAQVHLSGRDAPERGPLLLWMIFTGLSIFAAMLLWYYGFIHLMVASDRTYISSLIAVLYIVTCGHCFWRTRAIAREAEAGRRCLTVLSAPDRKGADVRRPRPAGGNGDRSHPEPRHEGGHARRRAHRPDPAPALAGRSLARLQRLRRLRLGYVDEARPARDDHRLHHHAGADCGPGCRRQGRDEILDGSDERRYGGRNVHDAGGPCRLDPCSHPILHARCRDPARVLRCRRADRDAGHARAGAGAAS